MSSQESKAVDPAVAVADAQLKANAAAAQSNESDDADEAGGPSASSSGKKKQKKSKRKMAKELLTGKGRGDAESDLKKALQGLTPQQAKELIALNPSLAQEVSQASGSADPSPQQTADMLKKMSLQDIMTGLAAAGKNAKDMGAYKFWQTQPVPKFGEDGEVKEEGPVKAQTMDEISKEPAPLVAGFEWVQIDLTSDEEIKEVYELLNGHYVEDDEAMFRFNYSPSILRWCVLRAPPPALRLADLSSLAQGP